MIDLSDKKLGESKDRIACDGSAEVRALAVAIATQCLRTLDVCGRHLDPVLFDNAEFGAVVKRLALRSRFSRIRLLILQPASLHGRGHALLRLAQELPTFIHVRIPSHEHKDFNEAMLIADEAGYIHRQLSDRYDGTANFNDKLFASELVRRFDTIWDHGDVDQNFRRLSL